jgi:hypothetical protein
MIALAVATVGLLLAVRAVLVGVHGALRRWPIMRWLTNRDMIDAHGSHHSYRTFSHQDLAFVNASA